MWFSKDFGFVLVLRWNMVKPCSWKHWYSVRSCLRLLVFFPWSNHGGLKISGRPPVSNADFYMQFISCSHYLQYALHLACTTLCWSSRNSPLYFTSLRFVRSHKHCNLSIFGIALARVFPGCLPSWGRLPWGMHRGLDPGVPELLGLSPEGLCCNCA